MRRDKFVRLMEETFADALNLNKRKGKDYAGDEDALSNFKEAAQQLGTTPEKVWAVYAHKHWSAIMAYCSEGKLESEPIEMRIKDVIVYAVLLLGLVEDKFEGEEEIPAAGTPIPGTDRVSDGLGCTERIHPAERDFYDPEGRG